MLDKKYTAGVLAISVFMTSGFITAQAQTSEEKGFAIAKERKVRDSGWNDSIQQTTMVLRNAKGKESIREIRIKSLEVIDDGDKGLTIFDKPADLKGTAFLSFSHINKADDQWLYLPSLKRVKRISSRNKAGPFMGSEFSYEDLSSFELEKFKFNYLKDDTFNGNQMFVIESFPTDKYSGYTKLISWVDQDQYLVHKVDFYDRKSTKFKTLTANNYKLYLNKFWRAESMTMINHQTGKSTTMTYHDVKFNQGLTERDFNKNSLKRAR